jgi:hypothetical protein
VCSNGCILGAFQERFRAEFLDDQALDQVKHEFLNVCEPRDSWQPTGLEQGSCYHALGHLLMYATNANAQKASNLCDELVVKSRGRDFTRVCYDGVFMQIYQPLEPEDFALIAGKQPKKEDVASFCRNFSPEKQVSCMSESGPLFAEEVMTPGGFMNFCSALDEDYRGYCIDALQYVLVVQFQFDEARIAAFCEGLPQEVRNRCAANTASRFIETDWNNITRAVGWCERAASFGSRNACFDELVKFATFTFAKGSDQYFSLCRSLPDPWGRKCLGDEN